MFILGNESQELLYIQWLPEVTVSLLNPGEFYKTLNQVTVRAAASHCKLHVCKLPSHHLVHPEILRSDDLDEPPVLPQIFAAKHRRKILQPVKPNYLTVLWGTGAKSPWPEHWWRPHRHQGSPPIGNRRKWLSVDYSWPHITTMGPGETSGAQHRWGCQRWASSTGDLRGSTVTCRSSNCINHLSAF